MHIAATSELRILLAEFRGNFCQGLGRRYSHRDRNGGQSPTLCRNPFRIGIKVNSGHTSQIQKRLIYGIYFHSRHILLKHPAHPLRHITVKGHVSRKDSHIILFHDVSDLEERVAHLYAQSLCLIASSYGTTVIIRQNNDRLSLQIRAENPLTGSKEIIAVCKSEHTYIFLIT